MIRLALLRHGHTKWNRDGKIQGTSDIKLDDQARSDLAGYALPTPWDQADLWSSPLKRAVETAKIVAGRAPEIAPELTEMNWGDWEGRSGVDLLAEPDSGFRHIEDWGWGYHAPNGECPAKVRDRVMPWVTKLNADCVAVCHIGIMRVILAQASGWNFDGPAPFVIKRNRLYVLRVSEGKISVDPETTRLIKREAAQ